MVSETKICLYKSGVHKILGVPRKWSLKKPGMSLAVFKKGLEKRKEALQKISKDSVQECAQMAPIEESTVIEKQEETVIAQNEDCNGENSKKRKREEEDCAPVKLEEDSQNIPDSRNQDQNISDSRNVSDTENVPDSQNLPVAQNPPDAENRPAVQNLPDAQNLPAAQSLPDAQNVPNASLPNNQQVDAQQHQAPQAPEENKESKKTTNVNEERAKRKAELQDKLQTLTAEKHRLVQLLKQILTNEEESRKRLQTPTLISPCPKPADLAQPTQPIPPPVPLRPMDLEEGELDYARTPSPRSKGLPPKQTQQAHQNQGGPSRLGYNSNSGGHPNTYPKSGRIVKWEDS